MAKNATLGGIWPFSKRLTVLKFNEIQLKNKRYLLRVKLKQSGFSLLKLKRCFVKSLSCFSLAGLTTPSPAESFLSVSVTLFTGTKISLKKRNENSKKKVLLESTYQCLSPVNSVSHTVHWRKGISHSSS